jgi:cellulose biosynthesis protein BcsQ
LKTKVIGLYAGSGVGKSTLAANVYSKLKAQGTNCELVREYVKTWAWNDKKIGPYDQLYVFAKQAHSESQLYGKVDYIITDCPILLCPIYENFNTKKNIILPTVLNFLDYAQQNGVEYINFFLKRNKPFDGRGRYEDEKTARKIDKRILTTLKYYNIPFTKLENKDLETTTNEILERIK